MLFQTLESHKTIEKTEGKCGCSVLIIPESKGKHLKKKQAEIKEHVSHQNVILFIDEKMQNIN